MTVRAIITGCGHYLPKRIVENSEIERTLDTSDEWISSRSGIKRRHFANEDETTSAMATLAAKEALEDAGLVAGDIDAIILATSTSDLTFPSAATMVQANLGMTRGFAYDVQAVCAGFVFALANANALIISGQAKKVLVIGGGNSACDVAVETARISKTTAISWRRGYYLIPKFMFGLTSDIFALKARWLPRFLRLSFMRFMLELIQGKNEDIGLPKVTNHILATHPTCLLYTSPSPRDRTRSRMPSSA